MIRHAGSYQVRVCMLLLSLAAACRPATAQRCSLVRLITTPERFDGKRVVVVGRLVSEFEEEALYLSDDDARMGLRENAVILGSLRVTPPRGPNDWLRVRGRFLTQGGSLGQYAGAIYDIDLMEQVQSVAHVPAPWLLPADSKKPSEQEPSKNK